MLIGRLKVFLRVKGFSLREKIKVIRLFYKKPKFALFDLLISLYTFFQNPYRLCRKYWIEKESHQIYGEMPLSQFAHLTKWAEIQKEDHFLELGSGLGRISFWIATQGIKAAGIEKIPSFSRASSFLAKVVRCKNVEFFHADNREKDFSPYSFIYLYATVEKEKDLKLLFSRMRSCKKGTKVLSISAPASQYDSSFCLLKKTYVELPWGKAEVFLAKKV